MIEYLKHHSVYKMLSMNMILMLLLTIFPSCQSISYATHVERCVILLTHNKCRCHTYEINEEYIGRIGASYDKPLQYCDKLVGFTPVNWTELRSFVGELQREAQDFQ
jgi:hypothetical protein